VLKVNSIFLGSLVSGAVKSGGLELVKSSQSLSHPVAWHNLPVRRVELLLESSTPSTTSDDMDQLVLSFRRILLDHLPPSLGEIHAAYVGDGCKKVDEREGKPTCQSKQPSASESKSVLKPSTLIEPTNYLIQNRKPPNNQTKMTSPVPYPERHPMSILSLHADAPNQKPKQEDACRHVYM